MPTQTLVQELTKLEIQELAKQLDALDKLEFKEHGSATLIICKQTESGRNVEGAHVALQAIARENTRRVYAKTGMEPANADHPSGAKPRKETPDDELN
ncbi:MAG: hypothetical protein GTO41_04500 [Burkholderiales bacterium]|nr:hypothetical protein [Burkholderiales bacterium]